MENNSNPKLSSDYMLYKDDESGELFLINITSGNLFQLNDTSYVFLSLCNGECSYNQIQEKLLTIYSVGKEELNADFSAILVEWEKQKIIVTDSKVF